MYSLTLRSSSRQYHNAVFVDKDESGKPKYAALRSTLGSSFRQDASGSDKRYSFRLLAREPTNTVHLFEAAIDLLSYATYLKCEGSVLLCLCAKMICLTTLYIGFSMGTAPVISYNYGSGDVKQLKKTVRICFRFIAGISIFAFLFSLLGGESIAKVFAENNRNVFEITKNGFIIFSFSFLFSGCNIFSSALFTALSNGKASATISFLRTFGFLTVFLLVLPRFLDVTGVWLAVPLAELLTLMLAVYLIMRASEVTY